MSMEPFIRQAQNNAWANATLYAAVTAMPADAYTAAYPSFFGSIPRTLNHIYEVDLFYIDALTNGGTGRAVFDRDDIMDPTALAAAQAKSDAQLIHHCEGLDEARLHDDVTVERLNGPTVERRDYLLLHLFQHQIHHRGQVHSLLSQAGIDPPQLDDFFLEFGRVETAKPYWEGQ